MYLLENDPEYIQLMISIRDSQYLNPERMKESCEILLEKVKEKESPFAYAYAKLYLADYAVDHAAMNEASTAVLEAIHAANPYGYNEILIKAFNLQGILFARGEQQQDAAGCYMQALFLAQDINSYDVQAMVYANLSDTFMKLEDFDSALQYGKLAKECIDKVDDTNQSNQYNMVILLNLAQVYLELNEPEHTLDVLQGFNAQIGNESVATYEMAKQTYYALAKAKLENSTECCELIDQLQKEKPTGFEEQEVLFDILGRLFKYVLESRDKQRSTQCIKMLEDLPFSQSSSSTKRILMDYKVAFAMVYGTNEEQLKMYEKNYQLRLKEEKETNAFKALSIENKLALEISLHESEIMQKNLETFKEQSSIDELSQLPNRRQFNTTFIAFFNACKTMNQSLGVIAIDIDVFKYFNDTFGHLVGDSIIQVIARALKEDSKDIVPTRFGGDEFFVLCKDMSKEEIKAYLHRVFQRISQEQGNYVQENIYVSCGIAWGKIEEDSIPEKFLDKADKALYRAKEKKGNAMVFADEEE